MDLSWGTVLGIARNNAASPSDWPAHRHTFSRRALNPFAQRIAAKGAREQLLLPPQPTEHLRQLVGYVRCWQRVRDDWGCAVWMQRNLGVTAVLVGASGAGNTLAV